MILLRRLLAVGYIVVVVQLNPTQVHSPNNCMAVTRTRRTRSKCTTFKQSPSTRIPSSVIVFVGVRSANELCRIARLPDHTNARKKYLLSHLQILKVLQNIVAEKREIANQNNLMSNTNGGGGGFYEAYKQALERKNRAERGDGGNDAKSKPTDAKDKPSDEKNKPSGSKNKPTGAAASAQMSFVVEVCGFKNDFGIAAHPVPPFFLICKLRIDRTQIICIKCISVDCEHKTDVHLDVRLNDTIGQVKVYARVCHVCK